MPYGTLGSDVLQSSTAGTPPQFNDGNGTQIGTLCRAWVNFNGGTSPVVRGSFNVSSVVYNSTGNFTVNYTNNMPDGNYAVVAIGEWTNGSTNQSVPSIAANNLPAASNVRIALSAIGGSTTTYAFVAAAIFR